MPEVRIDMTENFVNGDRRLVANGTVEIGVFRIADQFHAFQNICPHQGGPVCQGRIMPKVVEPISSDGQASGLRFSDNAFHLVCPWHGYEFRFDVGEHPGSRRYRLKRFETVVKGGWVYVVV